MTGKFEFFSYIQPITPCFIGLLNGSHIAANFERTMKLESDLVIQKFLNIPNLKWNPISILQLLHYNPEYGVYFLNFFV